MKDDINLDENKLVLYGLVALVLLSVVSLLNTNALGFLSHSNTATGYIITGQCTNGIKDSPETDVDCGGGPISLTTGSITGGSYYCPRCETGKKCLANSDCKSNSCVNGVCACVNTAPSGIKLQPPSGTVFQETGAKVNWSLVSWGINCKNTSKNFTLQIAKDSAYGFKTVDTLSNFRTYYTFSGLTYHTYYWRVIADNGYMKLVSGYNYFIVNASPNPTDSDSDGFSDLIENYIGTNPNLACGTDWPANTNNAGGSKNKIDIFDVNKLAPPVFFSSVGSANYNKRYDLNADGKINIFDVNLIGLYFNTACQPSPVPPQPAPPPAPTGNIVLQPDGSSTIQVTFNGNPFAEGSNNPINGFLSLFGQSPYSSVDQLKRDNRLAGYELVGIDLDENTYTYALILRPGLDNEETVQSFAADPNVFNIG